MAQVKIGDYIYDYRQPEVGIIEIKTKEQVRDYSYVAPELIIKCKPDPLNPGKFLAISD